MQTSVKKRPVISSHEMAGRPSLRERNKAEKAQLIKEAARQLFSQNGYEATTMRDVAALADVGFGTISAYATDKAGLLAMLFVEDLEHLPPLLKNLAKMCLCSINWSHPLQGSIRSGRATQN